MDAAQVADGPRASGPARGAPAPVAATSTSLARDLDELARRARAEVGEADLLEMRRMVRASKALAWVGRGLIVASVEPVGFAVGVLALAAHRSLEFGNGHTALHGVYDALDETGRLHKERYRWELPIDEAAWRRGHNLRHHPYTGIVGRDADVSFGFLRLAAEAPHRTLTYVQFPVTVLGGLPHFALIGQLHFSGVLDLLFGNGLESRFDFLPDASPRTVVRTLLGALRKPTAYYAKSYVLYPLLVGPFAPKLVLGTWLAERLRDLWTSITILSGHAGPDVAAFPEGTRAASKDAYYRMQIEATNDFEVPWILSVLCGGLDRQIEHHLFPDLPQRKTREIAPEVKRICEKHGVRYRSESLPRTVWRAFRQIAALSVPTRAVAARGTAPRSSRPPT